MSYADQPVVFLHPVGRRWQSSPKMAITKFHGHACIGWPVDVSVPDICVVIEPNVTNAHVSANNTFHLMHHVCNPPTLLSICMQGFEIIKAVHLDHKQFSVEDDLLTPTFKLKRPQLLKHYQPIIDDLYKKLNAK